MSPRYITGAKEHSGLAGQTVSFQGLCYSAGTALNLGFFNLLGVKKNSLWNIQKEPTILRL